MGVTNPKRIDPSLSDCLDMFFYCILFFFSLFLYRKFDKKRKGMTVDPGRKFRRMGRNSYPPHHMNIFIIIEKLYILSVPNQKISNLLIVINKKLNFDI